MILHYLRPAVEPHKLEGEGFTMSMNMRQPPLELCGGATGDDAIALDKRHVTCNACLAHPLFPKGDTHET